MDFFNHGAWGYIFAKFYRNVVISKKLTFWIAFLFIVMGIMPDVIGWAGLQIEGDYRIYNIAHAWWMPLNLFPSYGMHVLLDSFTHGDPFYWWKGTGIIFEVLSWLIVIASAILLHLRSKEK